MIGILALFACGRSDLAPPQKTPANPTAPPSTDTGLGTLPVDDPPPQNDSGVPADTATPSTDAGDTPEQARVLPTPSPALTVSDTIDPPGDEDWFQVDLVAGDTIWIGALAALRTPPSPLAPVVEVRSADGTTLELARGMPLSIAENDTAIAFEAPDDGSYFIGVRATTPDEATLALAPDIGGPDHAYSLRLEQAPPFESEPHNDNPDTMRTWLEEDGNYAYLGDPFIAGWPLFSFRSNQPGDTDTWPWEVDGALEDGAPADWELWSFSPWAGCAPTSIWSVTTDHPAHAGNPTLGMATTATLYTDPLYQLARHGLPVLPDVGLLVAAPPGMMWLTVEHLPTASVVGSACTGLLAGWTTDQVPTIESLPEVDGARRLSPVSRTADHATALAWGTLSSGEMVSFTLPADAARRHTHILLQAEQVGHPIDLTLTPYEAGSALPAITDNPLSGGSDPEVWNWLPPDTAPTHFTLTASSGQGMFLLQVHQTAAPWP